MSVENDEIYRMFNGFKEGLEEVKKQLKESIKEGQKDHKEIHTMLKGLCDRMLNTENTIDNHLLNSEKSRKTTREKTLLLIAALGCVFGAIGVLSRLFT